MLRFILRMTLIAWLVGGGYACAQEATTFSYDALGRLVGVLHNGGPSTGVLTTYTYDPASNRTNYVSTTTAIIGIAAASANEGSPLTFTVTRSGVTTTAVTVNYATSDNTAIAGTNYTASSGTLTFAAGVTSQTFTVPTIDDHVYTPNLTMTITLSSPSSGAVLGAANATGTVVNIDTATTLSIAAASANEGSPLTFTVTQSGSSGNAVSVNYATSDGTAAAGTNYTAASGTLSFAAGSTSQAITVGTIDDHVATPNLTMTMTLSSPSGWAVIGTSSATGTIVNIDTMWTSTLTAGYIEICPQGICATRSGFGPAIGSMTPTSFGRYTITVLQSLNGTVLFTLSCSAVPPNSGWASIAVPGVGTLLRTTATYSTSGTTATWSWAGNATVTSGTVTIQ